MLTPTARIFLLVLLLGLACGMPANAQERFIDNGNGTVTDLRAGLMWTQTDNQKDIFWRQAAEWIRDSFAAGLDQKYENWRLPTVTELQSLYLEDPTYHGYPASCGYAVKMIPQISLSCILVWSSDTALGLPLAFNYYLGNAFTVDLNDNAGCRVLAVRNIR
jgi:hypothetical protein